jgi:hypothetical protein
VALPDQQRGGCDEEVSADTGQPVFFRRGSLTSGLSARASTYGQKFLVVLWIYNPSEQPRSVESCGDIDHFWQREIEVLDLAGNQVPSRAEEKRMAEQRRNPGHVFEVPFRCWLNYPIDVPPHSCVHGSLSKPDHDFVRDLNGYYSLAPGRYALMTKKNAESERGTSTEQRATLPIVVLKP